MLERTYIGYGGIRGLALAASPGWGLTVGYGMAFLFYIKGYWINKNISIVTAIKGLY